VTERIVVISDTQMPYDNRRAVRSLVRFIGDTQPDRVIHIGDLMDYPTPSRWSKGTAEEFSLRMLQHNEQAKRRLLAPLRDVYSGPIGVHEGNHDERPRVYLERYAPALAQYTDQFHIERLLDFDGFGIDLLPTFNKVAPGWITTHGHKGQISLSRNAGYTALNAALKFDSSVVIGHTHRAGIASKTHGYAGLVKKQLVGVEVGHLMDQRQAEYLKGGTGNWQQGFAILDIDGPTVVPTLVPITNRFIVNGRTWEVR
jgi:predicted phosphodiesterase